MKKWLETTTKQVVWWMLINGTVWIYLSYILAYLGRDDIAESLSRVVAADIIGTVGFYCLKSTVENVFKNNEFSAVRKKNDNTRKRDF